MIVGFTGTRKGMSEKQIKLVTEFLKKEGSKISKILHGGCIGADMDFHNLCKEYKREVYPGHSTYNKKDNSFKGDYEDADIIHQSKPYLERNKDIVDNCDILIATPLINSSKGGTWYTINYAEKNNKLTIIL